MKKNILFLSILLLFVLNVQYTWGRLPVNVISSLSTGTIIACAGSPSASPYIQQFMVSGINHDDLKINAPAGFEVSLNANDDYASNLTINPPPGINPVTNQTIYVRSSTSAPAGDLRGSIAVTEGALTEYVSVNGVINPLPTVDNVPNQIVLNGQATDSIHFTGQANTFIWTNDTPGIGLRASGDGDISSFNAINSTNNIIKATITVTPYIAPIAYVGDKDSADFIVVNMLTHKAVSRIPTISFLQNFERIYLTPDGTTLYSTTAAGRILATNLLTQAVRDITPANTSAIKTYLSTDGTILYGMDGTNQKVVLISTSDYSVINTINNVVNSQIVLSADNKHLYTNSITTKVIIRDTQTGATIPNAVINVNGNANILISRDEKILYMADNSGILSVVDISTGQVISSFTIGKVQVNMKLSPDGSKLYVSNNYDNSILVLDALNQTLITRIAINNPFDIAISNDGKWLYVVNANNGIYTINAETNVITNVTNLGGTLGPIAVMDGGQCTGLPINFSITVKPSSLAPVITTTPVLGSLTTTYGTPSHSTTFSIAGINLNNGILIIPPDGYEISTDSITYTNTLTINATGTLASQNIYIRLTRTTPAGNYPGDILLTSPSAADVKIAVNGTVNKAPLTIKADNKTKTYGDDNPELTATYTGFVNGENNTELTSLPILTTTALTTSPLGNYPIVASGGTALNYDFNYVDGVLSINASPINVTVPNTFTPNGDGINDTWVIKNIRAYPRNTVNVFNRNGTKLFTSNGYSTPWDGKYKGSIISSGTYYYIIDLKNSTVLSGYVTVIP